MSTGLISKLRNCMAATGLAVLGGLAAANTSGTYAADGYGAQDNDVQSNSAYEDAINRHLNGNDIQQAGAFARSGSAYHPGGYENSCGCEAPVCDGSCGIMENTCGCETIGCDGGCDTGGHGMRKSRRKAAVACQPWWAHRTGGYAEFLYLTPGSSDLIHAIETDGLGGANPAPTGPMGILDMDAEPGYRFGLALAANQCSSLNLAYTRWDGGDTNTLTARPGNIIDSQVIHPSGLTAGAASLQATAAHDMSFQTLDFNYRQIWKRTENSVVNWSAGLRYGNTEQRFVGSQTIAVATGLTTVSTDIDFDGFGITGGLDFERYSCGTGLFLYGKGMGSLMAGEWTANYRQVNQFGGGVIANDFKDFHATPVLEAELGLGWMNHKNNLRLQTGYMMSGWYETVSTRGYIDSVRSNKLVDVGETTTYSGLTARISLLF
ncbi:hypothetical protein FF011L_07230 [Roseimaritima multifibrata]|uniref:Legionella pneumophila major outer membrane protein n=1 Tax=Roseimaritima multifibrata TaxID=1930274 RepID=A0A517MB22_9BACT|nr:Lpg1974 family pore-forming outer membrane protein [Roseimaritima multifibrata]QDS91987.1 hypothetical protein FF011L_07230 [Roseimaritima multifibrata]